MLPILGKSAPYALAHNRGDNIVNIPLSIWPLVAAAFFLLIAIAGGRQLVIINVTLGPLGRPSRGFAGSVSLLLLAFGIYLIIPEPTPEDGAQVNGVVLFSTFPALPESKYQVHLLPTQKIARMAANLTGKGRYKTSVKPLTGHFAFSAADKVPPGSYRIRLVEDGRTLHDVDLSIAARDNLIIERLSESEFSVSQKDFLEYFLRRYTEGTWQDQLLAIEHLAHLVEADKTAMTTLLDDLKGQNEVKKRMAAYVLGRACRPDAADTLAQIMRNTSEDSFKRIRAAGFLLCPGASHSPDAEKFLYKEIVPDTTLDENGSTRTGQGRKIAAAYFLFQLGRKRNDRCILNHLIAGLKSSRAGVPQEIERILRNFLWKRSVNAHGWSTVEWEKWWAVNSGQFRDCQTIRTN